MPKGAPSYDVKFYSKTGTEKRLEQSKHLAVEEELTEYEIVKQVYMRTLTKYRSSLRLCEMRTKNPWLLKLANGRSFDVFAVFNRNNRLGIDVYTRLPLSETMVKIFAEKIKSAKCSGQIFTRECQSSAVPELCGKNGIELKYLKSDTSIDYAKIHLKTKMKLRNINI